MKADRIALQRWPDTETPGLDVDAAVPEARLGRGDGNVDGTGDVEGDPVIAGGGVGYVNWLVVDGHSESGRLELRRNRRGLNAGGSVSGQGQNENENERGRKAQQMQTGPRRDKCGNEITLSATAAKFPAALRCELTRARDRDATQRRRPPGTLGAGL